MTIVIKRTQVPLWHRVFPFLAWLPRVNRNTLRADLIAGITVALVAIPQSLAYAQLAGVPPYYGLYASFLPVIVGALWGSSPALSTGPVAMTSLLTAASVMTLAKFGTDQFYAYVILMALLSGLFQIILGVARMGVLINFLSYPVLRGFINAAAIIIALAQLPAMLGLKLEHSNHFMIDVLHVIEHAARTHLPSLAFGVGSLVALYLLKKYAPKLPGVLIVVIITTFISYKVGFEAEGGTVVGVIPQGLPSFSLPPFDPVASMHMLPAAFVIAIISFMEAMSSSKIIAIKKRIKWDENQELVGQGLAKVAAAFSTGMPVSGSFSRSALNLASGAETGLASVFSAVVVLITLFFFTPALYHLPKPVLAAIIMMAVFSLVDVQVIKDAWRTSRQDGIAAVVTFVATLAFAPNIQNGILTGILLSLVLFLFRTMRPAVVILGVDENGVLRSAKRYNLPKLHPNITAIRFDGQLYFANVAYFEEAVLYLVGADPDLREILVVADGINGLDASGVEMLRNLLERLEKSGVGLSFANVKENVLEVFKRSGLCERIGDENIYPSVQIAVTALRRKLETLDALESAGEDDEEAVAKEAGDAA
ncbi:MAG: SulP family inorganic anion transporter [Gammaproteobacteria bacterium]|nr:MAG: SulP family inorganic anion transporter [Gammaproteobacteria bacterium]